VAEKPQPPELRLVELTWKGDVPTRESGLGPSLQEAAFLINEILMMKTRYERCTMLEKLLSPTDLLARLTSTTESASKLIIITGSSGSGKTGWCLELIRQARIHGIEPVGLVSPAVFEQSVKIGIDLVDITNNERHLLGVKRDEFHRRLPEQRGFAQLHWLIDPEVLDWGNRILLGLSTKCDLLLLDELGPLEFLANNGLTVGMSLIDRKEYRLACVVVRPNLVQNSLERWPWVDAIYDIDQLVEIERE